MKIRKNGHLKKNLVSSSKKLLKLLYFDKNGNENFFFDLAVLSDPSDKSRAAKECMCVCACVYVHGLFCSFVYGIMFLWICSWDYHETNIVKTCIYSEKKRKEKFKQ